MQLMHPLDECLCSLGDRWLNNRDPLQLGKINRIYTSPERLSMHNAELLAVVAGASRPKRGADADACREEGEEDGPACRGGGARHPGCNIQGRALSQDTEPHGGCLDMIQSLIMEGSHHMFRGSHEPSRYAKSGCRV